MRCVSESSDSNRSADASVSSDRSLSDSWSGMARQMAIAHDLALVDVDFGLHLKNYSGPGPWLPGILPHRK